MIIGIKKLKIILTKNPIFIKMKKVNLGILMDESTHEQIEQLVEPMEHFKWIGYYSISANLESTKFKKIKDFEKFIAQIDACFVCTSNQEYVPFIKELIKHGKNLFITQSFLFISEHSSMFINLFKESQTIYYFSTKFRHLSLINQYKEFIQHASFIEIHSSSGFEIQQNYHLYEHIINLLDLAIYLQPSSVKNIKLTPIQTNKAIPILINLHLDYTNYAQINININHYDNKNYFYLKIINNERVYEINVHENKVQVHSINEDQKWSSIEQQFPLETPAENFKKQIAIFQHLIQDNQTNLDEDFRYFKLVELFKFLKL